MHHNNLAEYSFRFKMDSPARADREFDFHSNNNTPEALRALGRSRPGPIPGRSEYGIFPITQNTLARLVLCSIC